MSSSCIESFLLLFLMGNQPARRSGMRRRTIDQIGRCGPNSNKLVRLLCANVAGSYETSPTLSES
jgi:hypothetical protein